MWALSALQCSLGMLWGLWGQLGPAWGAPEHHNNYFPPDLAKKPNVYPIKKEENDREREIELEVWTDAACTPIN